MHTLPARFDHLDLPRARRGPHDGAVRRAPLRSAPVNEPPAPGRMTRSERIAVLLSLVAIVVMSTALLWVLATRLEVPAPF